MLLTKTFRALTVGAALGFAVPAFCADTTPTPAGLNLHVPSPDWRDQIIYFVMTDRFSDGDPSNNDQGAGEFEAGNGAKYNGGDFKGLQDKLAYIKGLGATAIWITPPVLNQWWDDTAQHGGYHGYWASDFKAVDPHLGTLADYQRLSHAIHSAGMYLIQDIVVNHTGNFFAYSGGWDAKDPTKFYRSRGSNGQTAPIQPPFNLNDPRRAADRNAAIYHWTPDVSDYTNRDQQLNWQMSGLDDLNTENPVVRRALRDSYGYWIKAVGVDAYRVDTAFYVPPEYFADFMRANDPRYPGMEQVARQTGRRDFLVFGEGFGIDKPYADTEARRIDAYMRDQAGHAFMPSMINFPLYGSLQDAFARGRPTAELAWRINNMMRLHQHPHLMPTFIDNHDVDRFLSAGSVDALKQSVLAMFTLPGIPTIYYGTEQGFTEPRAAMFKAGFQSGGRDRFDTDSALYRFIQGATALRQDHKLFSRGIPVILKQNAASAGAMAWKMQYGQDAAIVVFNTADKDTLLDNLQTGLAPGTVLKGLFAIDGAPRDIVVGAQGLVHMVLPARAGLVWQLPTGRGKTAASTANRSQIRIAALPSKGVAGDFNVSGTASGLSTFKLVVDGQLDKAQQVTADAAGRWQASIDTSTMIDPNISHSLVAWSAEPLAVSASQTFTVTRQWTVLSEFDDPTGDDVGPSGKYVYPLREGWREHRQLDIRHVRVSGSGGALKLDLTMNAITTLWNPPNGFDHVAFTVFVELPGREGGSTVMPLQNGSLPEGMRWHVRLRAHGWSNALFTAQGASATQEGTPIAGAANIAVNRSTNTITFILSGDALGGIKTLSGVKLYINTWDWGEGYRSLTPQAQESGFGGGDGSREPLVLDDTKVIRLP